MSRNTPSFRRYLGFACLSVGLAVVGYWLFMASLVLSVDGVPDAGSVLVFGLVMTVLVGWVIWGPILASALFPGYHLYRWVHRAICARRPGHILPNLVAATTVSLVSWGAAVAVLIATGQISGSPGEMTQLLLFGTPAALVSATLILIKCEDA